MLGVGSPDESRRDIPSFGTEIKEREREKERDEGRGRECMDSNVITLLALCM